PNQQKPSGAAEAVADPYYLIRRAILLRSILLRDAPQLFQRQDGKQVLNIDPGVLRALLEIRAYKHGVRSMESLIAMSLLTGKNRFERSCLPAEAQLDMHVDACGFLALVQQIELEGELLEKLAEAAHEVFCEGLRSKEYHWGPQTDDERKTHSSLKPYAELPEDEKRQNRGHVQDIPNKLARVGYVMIPARSNESPFDFPGSDLELLAEIEHERWMQAQIEAGWRWAPKTDKDKRLHPDLLPWHTGSDEERARLYTPTEIAAIGPGELPEEEKDKDRNLVRGIPRILAKAGYTIVQISKGKAQE
ncbi:MAG TPA: RyR domain-containing protein, partial [Candidatus Binatia bacterium]|nr:RyR domain-containing protein [Candidatus Binatia bacterium]